MGLEFILKKVFLIGTAITLFQSCDWNKTNIIDKTFPTIDNLNYFPDPATAGTAITFSTSTGWGNSTFVDGFRYESGYGNFENNNSHIFNSFGFKKVDVLLRSSDSDITTSDSFQIPVFGFKSITPSVTSAPYSDVGSNLIDFTLGGDNGTWDYSITYVDGVPESNVPYGNSIAVDLDWVGTRDVSVEFYKTMNNALYTIASSNTVAITGIKGIPDTPSISENYGVIDDNYLPVSAPAVYVEYIINVSHPNNLVLTEENIQTTIVSGPEVRNLNELSIDKISSNQFRARWVIDSWLDGTYDFIHRVDDGTDVGLGILVSINYSN